MSIRTFDEMAKVAIQRNGISPDHVTFDSTPSNWPQLQPKFSSERNPLTSPKGAFAGKSYSTMAKRSVQKDSRTLKADEAKRGIGNSRQPRHRRIAFLFSYTGGFIMAVMVTQSYLNYETTTNVYIAAPQDTELPSVSVCFFYRIPHLKHEKGEDGKNLTNLTLGQINQLLPTFNEFVKDCQVLDSKNNYTSCMTVYQETSSTHISYLSLFSKCYTMFEGMETPIKYTKKEIGSNWLLDITLNVSRVPTNKVGIFLTHSTNELDESLGNPSFLQFDTKNNNRATVTYERTRINKLPPPHDSKCFNYETSDSTHDCKNRATCIRKCIVWESYENSKAWVDQRYVRIEDHYLDGRFGIESEANFTEFCFNKYSEEPCVDYLYNAIMASQFYSPFRDQVNSTFQINVAYPLGMETVVEYVAVQSLLDYICFVCSIVSLWTEASMVRISEYLLDVSTSLLLRLLETEHFNDYQIDSETNHINNAQGSIAVITSFKPTEININTSMAGYDVIPNSVGVGNAVGIGVAGGNNDNQLMEEPTSTRNIYKSFPPRYNKPSYIE
uniref:Uncharacterized protein n=1 Tax=Tetranychus urticae TaxID=32264 RepID=T1JZ30_TETUR